MRNNTLVKILYPSKQPHELSSEEMAFAQDLERQVKKEEKIREIGSKIESLKDMALSEADYRKESKKLHAELSRVRKDVILQLMLSRVIEARIYWRNHEEQIREAGTKIRENVCGKCMENL